MNHPRPDPATKREQARAIGERWAEWIARTHIGLELWQEASAPQVARRLVRAIAQDPREIAELAIVCCEGAAAWWVSAAAGAVRRSHSRMA